MDHGRPRRRPLPGGVPGGGPPARSEIEPHRRRLRRRGPDHGAAPDVLHHGSHHLQRLRLPGRAGLGLFEGSGDLLHPGLRDPGLHPLLLPGPAGRAPGAQLRLRDPGRDGRPPLRPAPDRGDHGAGQPAGLHPLPGAADAGRRLRGLRGHRGPGSARGGRGHRLRGGPDLRPAQRRPGSGLDQHLPGDLHDGARLGAGAVPALAALRRRGAHVRAARRRALGAAAGPRPDQGRRALELGRLQLDPGGHGHRLLLLAAPLHEGLHGAGRGHHPAHRGPLPHLSGVPDPAPAHRLRGGPHAGRGPRPGGPDPAPHADEHGPAGDPGGALLRRRPGGLDVLGRRHRPRRRLHPGARRLEDGAGPPSGGRARAQLRARRAGSGDGGRLRRGARLPREPGRSPDLRLRTGDALRPHGGRRPLLAGRHRRRSAGRPGGRDGPAPDLPDRPLPPPLAGSRGPLRAGRQHPHPGRRLAPHPPRVG